MSKLKCSPELNTMRRVHHIHFVGMGGVGMCGIAEVLLNLGYRVSGSDCQQSLNLERLAQMGAVVYSSHAAAHIGSADVLVVSSAIPRDNPECLAAQTLRIPIISRAEMLAELMRFRTGIAIAGTHGKTTTTSLVAAVLAEANLDPTFVIGGKLNGAGCNAKLGQGQYFVAEADESDASFLQLMPTIAIVTNIDADHMATYDGDFSRLTQTFINFLHRLPFYGLAIVCIDDEQLRAILPQVKRPIVAYGFSADADVQATNYQQHALTATFDIVDHRDNQVTPVRMQLPGKHNVQNALAAFVLAKEEGVPITAVQAALCGFEGIGRRFQVSQIPLSDGEITLIDDYGHHPTELRVTIDTIRTAWPDRRLIHAFQPHRYTRTQDLFAEFTEVLIRVDKLVLFEVYAAGETEISGANGQSLATALQQRGMTPIFINTLWQFFSMVPDHLRAGDILLVQGAGSIGQIAHHIRHHGFEHVSS